MIISGKMIHEVTKEKAMAWVSFLQHIPCTFWACDGPTSPFETMKTCQVCALIQDIRYHIDGKPRLPNIRQENQHDD